MDELAAAAELAASPAPTQPQGPAPAPVRDEASADCTTGGGQQEEAATRPSEPDRDAGGGTDDDRAARRKARKKKKRLNQKRKAAASGGGAGGGGGQVAVETAPVRGAPAVQRPRRKKLTIVTETKTIICGDVANAAQVEWGEEGPTARMVELQRRHDDLIDAQSEGGLTLNHLKDHNDFLAQLSRSIADEGEQMKRRYRIAMAKQSRSVDHKRNATYTAQANSIQRREKRYNNEVAMTKFEVEWLHTSPAYLQAMKYLEQNWIRTAKGEFVSKKDLKEDLSVGFDDLLSTLKEEEEQGLPPPTLLS